MYLLVSSTNILTDTFVSFVQHSRLQTTGLVHVGLHDVQNTFLWNATVTVSNDDTLEPLLTHYITFRNLTLLYLSHVVRQEAKLSLG